MQRILIAAILLLCSGVMRAQSPILDEIRSGEGVHFELVANGMQTSVMLRSPDGGKTVLGTVYIGKANEGEDMLCQGTIKGEQVHLFPIKKPEIGELFYIAFGDYEARLYMDGVDTVIVVPKKKTAK